METKITNGNIKLNTMAQRLMDLLFPNASVGLRINITLVNNITLVDGIALGDDDEYDAWVDGDDDVTIVNRDTLGYCDDWGGGLYDVFITNNDEWPITLGHELYHVFQSQMGLPMDCVMAEAFGCHHVA